MATISEIVGLTPIEVVQTDDTITMRFSNGAIGRWHHSQGCCEQVSIEDVFGEWDTLYGHPLLVAEERANSDEPPAGDYVPESFTWTFYAFRSVGGSVDVRWYGTSNGYYSERVDFNFIPASVAVSKTTTAFDAFREEADRLAADRKGRQ